VAKAWSENIDKLKQHPVTKAIFLRNNKSYGFGEVHQNINLANTLQSIAKEANLEIPDMINALFSKEVIYDTIINKEEIENEILSFV